MDYLNISQSLNISGAVSVSGAKNAALPLIASTILSKNALNITNIPEVVDIKTLLKLLNMLGAQHSLVNNTLNIDTSTITKTKATYDIVKTMRASILVLGPLLARFGHCDVSLPGGCAIGARPIDLHLKALEQMGAEITIHAGYVHANAPKGLKGATIVFDKITVTGTENIVMAAALAHGTTKIVNAAREPEVVQLCEVLRDGGVKIEGIGTAELTIYGTEGKLLNIKKFRVIPDRIEAGTYLCAGAITNRKITVSDVEPKHMEAVLSKLIDMGFGVEVERDSITLIPANKIKAIDIITKEYPGFPTDMQAQFMALATQANGVSTIEERLFENRFMHVSELIRLGASMHINRSGVNVEGPTPLYGADVMATDLRASSALVLAAIVAEGETNIHRIYHLNRGYESLERKLGALGVAIKSLKE